MTRYTIRLALTLTAIALASVSAHARFLQNDPVGYDADLNLYTYVGNNPTNMADPHGLTGVITVTNGVGVRIIIPVVVSGNASPSDVARVTGNISNKWTGTFGRYNVTTSVVVAPNDNAAFKSYGTSNTLNVLTGPTDRNGGHSYETNPGDIGGSNINITMQDVNASGFKNGEASKGPDTPAHECGHCLGLPDVQGMKGGIMDQSPGGTAITEGDIDKILTSPQNIVKRVNSQQQTNQNQPSQDRKGCGPIQAGMSCGGGADVIP